MALVAPVLTSVTLQIFPIDRIEYDVNIQISALKDGFCARVGVGVCMHVP